MTVKNHFKLIYFLVPSTPGESIMTSVESWSRCGSLAAAVLAERGVSECQGWTLSLERGGSRSQDQRNGLDYVLDCVSEMESAPHFPSTQAGSKPSHHQMSERPNNKVSDTLSLSLSFLILSLQ